MFYIDADARRQHLPSCAREELEEHQQSTKSTERIADRTDLNRETVKKRLQRIRAALARCLQHKGVLAPLPSPSS